MYGPPDSAHCAAAWTPLSWISWDIRTVHISSFLFWIMLVTHCSTVGGYSQGRASNSRFYWKRDSHNMEQRVAKLRDGPGGMDAVREFRAKRIVLVDQWMQVTASSTSFVTRLTVICTLFIRVLMHWTHGQPEAKRRPPECAGQMRTISITCMFQLLVYAMRLY